MRPYADDAMPHSHELEAAVLGALLLEPRYIADVRGIIAPSAFYESANAMIYGIMCDVEAAGDTADMVTVATRARTAGIGADYVAALSQTVGTGVDVMKHARLLADMEVRRRLILYAEELKARARVNSGGTVSEWAAQTLDDIAAQAVGVSARHIGEILAETLDSAERRQRAHRRGEAVGITTGLHSLDGVTGGWQGGQLIVLAARPAMGKTAAALTFTRAAALAGVPVCFFSLEMPDAQLAGRLIVGASGVSVSAFRSGDLNPKQWQSIEQGAEALRQLPVYVSDASSVSMEGIRAQCRILHRRGRCGMVVIDYLQLIASEDEGRGNREREVAKMSRAAKLLAKELDVPVILLAQLSRRVEERADKTPLLSDLRESGAIEQDADVVIFIDRPAVYGVRTIEAGRFGTIDTTGVGRFTIAKNREGCTGFTVFRHNASLTQIADYEASPAVASDGSEMFYPF